MKFNFKISLVFLAGIIGVILFAGNLQQSFEHAGQILYGSDGGRQLITISLTGSNAGSGLTKISISPVPQGRGFVALTFDTKQDEKLFAGQGSGSSDIYSINPVTGLATKLGNAGLGSTAVNGLDSGPGPDCKLYAVLDQVSSDTSGNNHLVTINKGSGAATNIGGLGVKGMDSIAFNSNGVLYGVVNTVENKIPITRLYSIVPTTGVATPLGQVRIGSATGPSPTGGILAIDFGQDNTLYGGTGKAVSPAKDGGLVGTINLSTLVFAKLPNAATNGSPLEAFAFLQGDNFPPNITINGQNPIKVQRGLPYSDDGASSFDCHDGTVNLSGSNTVNTSIPEVYNVGYTSTDNTGKTTTASRTVDVVDVLLDASTYRPTDQVSVTVKDYLAWRAVPPIGSITATLTSLMDDNGFPPFVGIVRENEPITLVKVPDEEGSYRLVVDLVDPNNNSLGDGKLAVKIDDFVFATYLGFNSAQSQITPAGSGAFGSGGIPPRSTDTIRFLESNRYALGTGATIKVNDATLTGATSVTALMTSSTDTTGFVITLLADATTGAQAGKFTSNGLVIFSDTTDSSASAQILKVLVGGTATARYTSTSSATADIVASEGIAFVTGYVPDTSVRSTCVGDTDNDHDGICDSWENQADHVGIRIPASVTGVTYSVSCVTGVTSGSDTLGTTVCPQTNRKDLYILYNWMTGHQPITGALNDVATALANVPVSGLDGGAVNGIQVHVFSGTKVGHQTLLKFISTSATETTFLSIKNATFLTGATELAVPVNLPAGVTDATDYLKKEATAKRQIFHYALFGHSQDGDADSSGLGERPGNDFWITLGRFTAHVGTQDQQAGTTLHEIGHNLSLDHGGGDSVNCKGNYISVMNYLYQFNAADGGFLTSRTLALSNYKYPNINENALSETAAAIGGASKPIVIGGISSTTGATAYPPLFTTSNTKIDWNRSGSLTSGTYAQNTRFFSDLADCQATGTLSITGYNDAANLVFGFRGYSTFDSGVLTINQIHLTTSTSGTPDPDSIAPGVDAVTDATANEGDTITGEGSIKDPDYDSISGAISFGDGATSALTITRIPEVGGTFSYGPHLYSDDGTFLLSVTINSFRDGGFVGVGTDTAVLTVFNVPPTVDAGADTTINEGDTFTRTGAFTDPGADTWTATVDYGDLSGVTGLSLTGKTFDLSHVYAQDADYTATVAVNDGDGGLGTDDVGVHVTNVTPVVLCPDEVCNLTIDEGGTYSTSGSFTDPGADAWSGTADYGDGSGVTTLTITGKAFSLFHTYADDKPIGEDDVYKVAITVNDDDGSGTLDPFVTVNNVAPIVAAITGATIDEGGTYSTSGSFTDPGADIWSGTADYGDGSGVTGLTLNTGKTFDLSHVYAQNSDYTATVIVTDDDGGSGSNTGAVTVINVAPAITDVTMTPSTTPVPRESRTITATFTDVGVLDTHTATIDWDDLTSSTAAVTESSGAGTATASHAYENVGTKTVTVTVSDGDGGSTTRLFTITVVNYNLGFFITPIDNSHFNPGRIIPVKIPVRDADGEVVTNANAFVFLDGVAGTSNAETENKMVFNAVGGYYEYHLQFPSGLASGSSHVIKVELNDGTSRSQTIFAS